MKKNLKPAAILILAALLLPACDAKYYTTSDSTFALDTIVQIKIYHDDKSDVPQDLINQSFALIRELEKKLSVHIEGSDLDIISQNAGIHPVPVDDITYNTIKNSIEYSNMTDGLFDVTAGPLIDLWAIDPPYGYVPSDEELCHVLKLIDYNKIDFSDNKIYLQDKDMVINLGAIAKGTIADEVKAFLVENGVESCFINLGGNVLLIGGKPDESPFKVGIQNPFDQRGAYLMSVDIKDMAIVSSGDYERFFEYEGKVYHHILDTKTGCPADNSIKQVSIFAPESEMADALSTSVLLLGIEKGLALINSMENTEAIFITKDKKIYITNALRDKIIPSENEMSDFTIVENPEELYD